MEDDSTLITKGPCPSPNCGSSDAYALYSDGHGYCFSCGHYEHGDGSDHSHQPRKKSPMSREFLHGEYRALKARGITEETCRKFGYTIARNFDGELVHVAPFYSTEDGTLVGQKMRDQSKDFPVIGNVTKKALLFGQQLWGQGGRKVVVTEGEIDAMTVSQMQNHKWPVVSIPNGTKAAKDAIARHLKWLCSFEEVVLMFDMDEQGRTATAECAMLFPPGKCKVASLTMKDPNELLVAGKGDEIITAIWQAQTYRPDGVVSFKDIKEAARRPIEMGLRWFSDRLTTLTYGRRYGEVYAFGAGTGIGKTDFLTQQITFDVTELDEKVGVFFLEQMPTETAKRLAGKFAGRRFHIPDDGWTDAELDDALDRLDQGKLFFYDSFGATDWSVIRETMRYLAHSEGVRIFYVDHLTALAAAEEDERKALEKIMAELAAIAKELGIIIHLVSHLATPEGKPHEEGGRVMIRHFKGSRAIGFWCHYMFGLERDQQHEDERLRSVTTFRVLKDRYTGQATGETIYLGYERDTGRLFESSIDFADESSPANDDCPF